MRSWRKLIHRRAKTSNTVKRYGRSTKSSDGQRRASNGGATICMRADKESGYGDERRRAQTGEPTLAVIDGGLNVAAGVQAISMPPKPKLLDQVRQAIRARHYSFRTEKAYVHWVKRFIFFHNKRHLKSGERRACECIDTEPSFECFAFSLQGNPGKENWTDSRSSPCQSTEKASCRSHERRSEAYSRPP